MTDQNLKTMRKAAKAVLWAASQIEKSEMPAATPALPTTNPPETPIAMPTLTEDNLIEYVDYATILKVAAACLSDSASMARYMMYKDNSRLLTDVRALEFAQSICLVEAQNFGVATVSDGLARLRDTEPLSRPLKDMEPGHALDVIGPVTVFIAVATMLREVAGFSKKLGLDTTPRAREANHAASRTLEFIADTLEGISFDRTDAIGEAMRKLRFLPPEETITKT